MAIPKNTSTGNPNAEVPERATKFAQNVAIFMSL
jgi:hypothetical protein